MSSAINMSSHERTAAIRQALSAFMTPQQVSAAVALWQEKYSGKPTFSLQYFVRECCAQFSLEAQRSQILQGLVKALTDKHVKVATGSSSDAAVEGAEADAALHVFQLLFRQITDGAGLLRGQEIRRYVAAGLGKMNASNAVKRSLELWLTGSMPVIEAAVPLPVMTALINRAYVGLCEYCGPVEADRILHEAVTHTASSAAARQFAPQRLL